MERGCAGLPQEDTDSVRTAGRDRSVGAKRDPLPSSLIMADPGIPPDLDADPRVKAITWKYLPDLKLCPEVQRPCTLGGTHTLALKLGGGTGNNVALVILKVRPYRQMHVDMANNEGSAKATRREAGSVRDTRSYYRASFERRSRQRSSPNWRPSRLQCT